MTAVSVLLKLPLVYKFKLASLMFAWYYLAVQLERGMIMFGFRRKKAVSPGDTVDTFVEATGGGWSDSPNVAAADGGRQADFVHQTLKRARAYALDNNIPVGREFAFIITDIPRGISSPHEIVFGLMMRATSYGLSSGTIADEVAYFTRIQ